MQVVDFARKQGLATFSTDDNVGDQLILVGVGSRLCVRRSMLSLNRRHPGLGRVWWTVGHVGASTGSSGLSSAALRVAMPSAVMPGPLPNHDRR